MALTFRSLSLLASVALLSTACTIRFGPIEDDTDWDNFTAQVAQSSSGSGSGGSSANGGASSAGGNDGGAGGADGAGDDAYCIDEFDSIGQTAAVCDDFAVAPTIAGMCNGYEPLGYLACGRAFEIYAPGHAENFAGCIANIASELSCNEDPVVNCVAQMYGDACTNDYVETTCNTWGSVCGDNGEGFDVTRCSAELNPFSDAGLGELVSCMNVQLGSCQERYDHCFDDVLTLG